MQKTRFLPAEILIIDDDQDTRFTVGLFLKRLGLSYTEIEDPREAAAFLREHPHDLVLLDIMMPLRNGYNVLEDIRQDESLSEIPVVFMTAKDLPTEHLEGYERGADYYLAKPFTCDQLEAALALFLKLNHSKT